MGLGPGRLDADPSDSITIASTCAIGGFDKCGLMTNGQVHELVGRVPESHRVASVLNSLRYVDVVKPEPVARKSRAYSPPIYIFGECEINDETGEANATIYRQQPKGNVNRFWFEHTIMHEVGHAVWERLIDREKRSEWYGLAAATVVFYNAQSREPDEQFANLYADYVIKPLPIRSRFSGFYEFLRREVFGGIEY